MVVGSGGGGVVSKYLPKRDGFVWEGAIVDAKAVICWWGGGGLGMAGAT